MKQTLMRVLKDKDQLNGLISKVWLWKWHWCIDRSRNRVTSFFFMAGEWQLVLCLSSSWVSERQGSTNSSLLLWFVRPITEAATFTAATLSGLSGIWHVESLLCVFLCVFVCSCVDIYERKTFICCIISCWDSQPPPHRSFFLHSKAIAL